MFDPNFIQISYINRLNAIFEQAIQRKNPDSSNGLAEIIYLLEKTPFLKEPFFHFWFHNLLTANQQQFIDVLNPKFFNIWQLAPKEMSLSVESYIKNLIDSNCKEEALVVLEKSVEYKVLIEPLFIEKIIKEQENFKDEKNLNKVFISKLKSTLPKVKENIISNFKEPK